MDIPSLHKKLLPNWSAGTVSKSLSTPASLETIKNGFKKLEMKSKMRVLLSLLNFDSKSKGECIGPIRELLRHAADKGNNGEWLSVIAGLVHARLLGNKEISTAENESAAFYHLENTADKIVEQLSRREVAAEAQHSLNFQPLELKFLLSADSFTSDKSDRADRSDTYNTSTAYDSLFSTDLEPSNSRPMDSGLILSPNDSRYSGHYSKAHFTYCGEVPDLISKASRSLEERIITDQKNKNMPSIGKNRLGGENNNNGNNGNNNNNIISSSGSGSQFTNPNRPRGLPIASTIASTQRSTSHTGQRQASKMLDSLDTGMQQRALSAALSGSSEGSALSSSSAGLKRKASTAPSDGGPVSKKGGKTEADPTLPPPPAADDKAPVKEKTADVIEKEKEKEKETEKEKEKEKEKDREKDREKEKGDKAPLPRMKASAAAAVAALLLRNNITDAAGISLPTAEKEAGKKETKEKETKEIKEAKEREMLKDTKEAKDNKAASTVSTDEDKPAVKPSLAVSAPSKAPVATAVIPSKVPPTASVSAPPAPSAPPSAPSSVPSSSSSIAASMDIQALFQSFPSLTPKDRVTIERFFADNWREHFPPSVTAETPVLKIKLRSDEKVDLDGQRAKETIYLHLEFNPHSWKKILKKNKILSK